MKAEKQYGPGELPPPRKESFIVLINEKDIRHYDTVRTKSASFSGISIRMK